MKIDLSAYQNSIWLAEPNRFRQAFTYAASYAKCYTREEVLARHREDLESVKAICDGGPMGNGVDESEEAALWTMDVAKTARSAALDVKADAPLAIRAIKGKVAIIPIHGPTDQRMSSGLMKAGGTSLDFVSRALDGAAERADVGAILLHIDSPGGGTFGVPELADKIHSLRDVKPVYAQVDSTMASASLWYGTAAKMVICTPGGQVGSHGVYCLHVDESKALEQEGITVTAISAGKHKVDNASWAKLSDDAKANLQESVNETYEQFTKALMRNRGVTRDKVMKDFGQGRMMHAQAALAAGLVDRVMPFEALLSKLTGANVTTGQARASLPSAEVLRLREARHRMMRGK